MELLTPPHIEIGSPRRFGLPFMVFEAILAIAIVVLEFCVSLLPLVILLLVGCYMDVWHADATAVSQFINAVRVLLYLALPLFLLLSLVLFPAVNANPLVRRIVSAFRTNDKTFSQVAVQITFEPRVTRGFRSLLEDADDVGLLRFEQDCVAFQGDSSTVAIPYAAITSI